MTDLKEADVKPFQNLLFLIRDWVYVNEHKGVEGGKKYIRKYLQVDPEDTQEAQSVREYLSESFESISCILMPEPPPNIKEGIMNKNQKYDGRTSEMSDKFKLALKSAVESILAVGNLQLKRMNGKEISTSTFKELVFKYFDHIKNMTNVSSTESFFEIIVKNNMNDLIDDLVVKYNSGMYESINIEDPNLESSFQHTHDSFKNAAIISYSKNRTMGTKSHKKQFEGELLKKIELKMEEIKTNVFERADQFNMDQEKDRVGYDSSEAFDYNQRNLLKRLIEIKYKFIKLSRKKHTMKTEDYESEFSSLLTKKQSIEEQIGDRKLIDKILKVGKYIVIGGTVVFGVLGFIG